MPSHVPVRASQRCTEADSLQSYSCILTHLSDWLTLTGSTSQQGRQKRQHGVVPASDSVLQLPKWNFDMVWHERLTCKVTYQQGFQFSMLSLSQGTGGLYVQSTVLPVVTQTGAYLQTLV